MRAVNNDSIFIECPCCDGEGRYQEEDYTSACDYCAQTGSIETQAEPITLADLDRMCGLGHTEFSARQASEASRGIDQRSDQS